MFPLNHIEFLMVLYDNRPFAIVSGNFFSFLRQKCLRFCFHVLPCFAMDFVRILPHVAIFCHKILQKFGQNVVGPWVEAWWSTVGLASCQSTLRKIYGMPSNVTGKSPMIRYQWRFIAGKLLGGISKHVWWHVSEVFSPDSWWFFWSSNVSNTAEGLDLDLHIPPIEFPDSRTWSKTGLARHPKDLD